MTTLEPSALMRRAPGWRYDLPSVHEVPTSRFSLNDINPPPNHADGVYMELPRSTVLLHGVVALLGIPMLLFLFYVTVCVYWNLIDYIQDFDWMMMLTLMLGPVICLWVVFTFVRLDLTLPRDEPIRFNRSRRKIYIYQFRHHYLYLFSRKHWGVKPVAYNWDDVTAEVYRVYAPGHGGLIENVMLSVRNPETDEVIDRVFFTHDLYRGEAYWAIARLFMQQGPEALPQFIHPPRDWNDDDGLSHMHCLAPKVHWPAAIDRESRTAPSEGEAQ
ncbi:DUF6708 domain-containing protein [Pseudomonas sp. AFG_SD02_1510_Pfu_092]|uniref:DUF6708 domain-containing protein n=1 Tax=Pseudomonas sp. AFG_SD02_1510_Pfu_092 TaxID=2259497 RepID=UPI001F4EC710|nr:DUF6708 domain-containing protein [Pseudomonas sp. AFG_SD02_1510_Pfu_092]